MSVLFTPLKLGAITVANRVVMAPMTRSRADNPERAPVDRHVAYYRQRAGAGLIITEGSQVSPEAIGYVHTPGCHTDAQLAGWRRVTDAVHADGGRIALQLWHVGRVSHPDHLGGALPLAPSAIAPDTKSFTPEGFKPCPVPRAMTLEDIARTQADFVRAAERALGEGGFDGVEIHASNGYLFHQFFNATSNQRTDAYGGSAENRARFLFETLDQMKARGVPLDRVGVRLNPSAHGVLGMTLDHETIPTFEHIVERLNAYDLAYLHLSEPFTDVSEVPGAVARIAEHFRPLYEGNLVINKGFTKETAEAVIEGGFADAVAFGVPFIANPDLVTRFRNDWPLAESDRDTFYAGGDEGYADYPPYRPA